MSGEWATRVVVIVHPHCSPVPSEVNSIFIAIETQWMTTHLESPVVVQAHGRSILFQKFQYLVKLLQVPLLEMAVQGHVLIMDTDICSFHLYFWLCAI